MSLFPKCNQLIGKPLGLALGMLFLTFNQIGPSLITTLYKRRTVSASGFLEQKSVHNSFNQGVRPPSGLARSGLHVQLLK